MFKTPNPFEPSPTKERKEAVVESQPREREFVGMVVKTVVADSASEEAGLQIDDIVVSVDDSPVQNEAGHLTKSIGGKGEPRKLSVVRGERTIEFTLTPRLNEETGRYMIGVEYVPGVFARKLDARGNEHTVERLKGSYYDAKGDPICEYAIDTDFEASLVSTGKGEFPAREVQSIELRAHGKSIDLMERFNHTNTHVFLSPEFGGGGEHSGFLQQIILNNIEQPGYVSALIHELVHADQDRDPDWRPYLSLYDLSAFTLDPEKVLEEDLSRGLKSIGKKIPELVDSKDIEPALRALDPILEKGRDLQTKMRGLKERAHQELQKVHAEQIKKLRAVLDDLFNKHHFSWADPLSQKMRDTFGREYKRLGLDTNFSRLQTSEDFHLFLGSDRAGIPADLEIRGSEYDAEKGLRNSSFQTRGYDGIEFRLSIPQSVDESDLLEKRIAGWNDENAKVAAELKEVLMEAKAVELRPGLTVFDALAYPRWLVERDAERGSLIGLRTIREETGIDFFRKLSPLSERARRTVAMSKNEELLKTQPASNQTSIQKAAQEMQELERAGGTTPVEAIRTYMNDIGATHKAIRKMKIEHGVHGKNDPKTPS
jgi:hypothetical protein